MVEHKLKSFHVYRAREFVALQKLAHTCEPVHAHTDLSRVHMCFQKSLQGKVNALPHATPTLLPCMLVSQMVSSQETDCLSMLDGTQKSPRATVSYWHLGQALSFPRGYSVNLVRKKA